MVIKTAKSYVWTERLRFQKGNNNETLGKKGSNKRHAELSRNFV